MSHQRSCIVAPYKGHEIRLSILRARRFVAAGQEWVCDVTILRKRSQMAAASVVVAKEFSFFDGDSEETALTSAFIDSLVLCDATID